MFQLCREHDILPGLMRACQVPPSGRKSACFTWSGADWRSPEASHGCWREGTYSERDYWTLLFSGLFAMKVYIVVSPQSSSLKDGSYQTPGQSQKCSACLWFRLWERHVSEPARQTY